MKPVTRFFPTACILSAAILLATYVTTVKADNQSDQVSNGSKSSFFGPGGVILTAKDSTQKSTSGTKGNNGVGNGEDPAPPGNPKPNDGPGTGPGNPGNRPPRP